MPRVGLDLDLQYGQETNVLEFTTSNRIFSDNNSWKATFAANDSFKGEMDHIEEYEIALIFLSSNLVGQLSSLTYRISADSGLTYPFINTLDTASSIIQTPLIGKYGYLTGTVASTFTGGPIQILTMYAKAPSALGYTGPPFPSVQSSTGFDLVPNTTRALNVRVINDVYFDYLYGKMQSRSTGAAAGYSDNIGASYQSLWNQSGFIAIPPNVGVASVLAASTSTQDSATGTGLAFMIVFCLLDTFESSAFFINFTGATPVTITAPVGRTFTRFSLGFGIFPGSANIGTPVSLNVGSLYLGIGAFSTTTGFATTYMFGRPGDNGIFSGVYTTPKGKRATVFQLKYSTDASKPVNFRTLQRTTETGAWIQIITDIVAGTIQPERSLFGGWTGPGTDVQVIAKRTAGTVVEGNFILAMHEIDENLSTSYLG